MIPREGHREPRAPAEPRGVKVREVLAHVEGSRQRELRLAMAMPRSLARSFHRVGLDNQRSPAPADASR